ncbi:Holliday junction resolvase RuvX [Collinsella sp. zg1085]|uniref:Holliday junction resolvase RuvX n=1 Tax=Collinsella sp. zg1085 TaxID=2844380 RepID=UPI001C0CBB72|nr:Holliday junction resolvase RuvX [Collinsella sp. zg1085]QWT17086.1 Holliday junction resolvase RuvX [Collinsella sp. zg1085]
MVALALDIGDTRIGIAASDRSARLANPVAVVATQEVLQGARSFRRILEDYEPDILVCGLPKTLSGDEGPQAAHVRELASHIQQLTQLPLVFVDERLSSREAKRLLSSQGCSEKQMRGKIDMIAASLFLQVWLDAQNREDTHEHGAKV